MTKTSRIMASLAFAAVCGFAVQSAEAGWRHGSSGSSGSSGSFGSSGSSGGWGSSGSSGSYGSGGSSGGSSSRAWRRAMRAERRAYRHASSGSHGSSGHYSSGSYGSHGSSGSSGYSSSSGSSGSYGGSGYYSASAQQAPSRSAQYVARTRRTAPAMSSTPSRLRLEVPADATVYLAGQKMTQTGQQRSYRLPELPSGQSYDYPVQVEVVREGRTLSARFSEQMSAGVTKEVTVAEQSGQLVVRRDGAGELLAQSR